MSIEGKHAYRFGFLKSEKWETLRLTCIAMDAGICAVCGDYNPSNDAHHLFYRQGWNNTKLEDLLTLCRQCHKKVHDIGEDVLRKSLWNGYTVQRPEDGPNCCICWRQDGIQLFKKTKTSTLVICSQCNELFMSKLELGVSFWKAFDLAKKEKRATAIRKFNKIRIREIVRAGIQRAHEKHSFDKALLSAGKRIRKYLLTEASGMN
jgi:hypothetical protein